jgi:hypothetical protein
MGDIFINCLLFFGAGKISYNVPAVYAFCAIKTLGGVERRSVNRVFNITGDAIQPSGGNKGLLGINVNGHGFWDGRNVGIFFTYDILFPLYITGASNINTYKGNMQELILGVGFRHIFTNRLTRLADLARLLTWIRLTVN